MSFAVLLALLAFGIFAHGRSAWVHSHGEDERHVHLPHQHPAVDEVFDLESWHASQHDHEPAEHDGDQPPAPLGFVVDMPELEDFTSPATSLSQTVAPTLVSAFLATFVGPTPATCASPPLPVRCIWPPNTSQRSGVATLLRSSHAILI